MSDKKPMRFRHDLTAAVFSEDGSILLNLPGWVTLGMAQTFAPKPSEARDMLIELRKRFEFTEAQLARILNASMSTVRKWLDGTRTCSGPAVRLIWLVHRCLIARPRTVQNLGDLICWGTVDFRMEGVEEPVETEEFGIQIARTQLIPIAEFFKQIGESLHRGPPARESSAAPPPQTANA